MILSAIIPLWVLLASCQLSLAHPSATKHARTELRCRDISIPVSAFAQNKILPVDLDLTLATSSAFVNGLLGLATVRTGGEYIIKARYCEPTVVKPAKSDIIQILVHGATYTTNYWSGLAPPGTRAGQDAYSWVKFAADQGYATLSVDRLCNGGSTKANSILECQIPLQVELLHQVTQLVRTGRLPGVHKSYNKVVSVCHSLGSLVCSVGSSSYPADVDAYILSGFSGSLVNGLSGIATQPGFLPASLVQPNRFATLDPGYLTASRQAGAQFLFYFGSFDQTIEQYDYDTRGTVALGEIATALLGQLPVPAYTGVVFVLNGARDSIFCQSNPITPTLAVTGDCRTGITEQARSLYPNVRTFGWHNTPNTGHDLNLHLTAPESFKAAHDFIAGVGL